MTPLERLVRGVGAVSVGLGVVATLAPQRVAAGGGVRRPDVEVLPLLVRLVAARQLSLGLALLTRHPVPVRRSAGLFLPITALDAAAVLAARRAGVLEPRATAMALAVLGTNAVVRAASATAAPGG